MNKMINNYNHANQYVKLKGRQINVGGRMARIFGLSRERIVPIGRESYNPIVVTYFIGNEDEHNILRSRYLIAKVDGIWKVTRLEALTEIMSFRQGNKFDPTTLISIMLIAKKEKLNCVAWFS
jgi:hypothetical protein